MKERETTDSLLKKDAIRQGVRERYASIAERRNAGCCGSNAESASGCCALNPGGDGVLESATTLQALGYDGEVASGVPEGSEMGLGCGNPLAIDAIQPGEVVLDLGSGGGFDCFLAAREVGPSGRVIGVDMTPEMISKARANAAKGGYPQVEFRLGEIEALPVADGTVDRILSNCVINLSPDKPRVFAEAFRVLKPGGRLAVSDIVQLKPMPDSLRKDFAAYTGCVAGAETIQALTEWIEDAGFVEIDIRPKSASGEFIDQWVPGSDAGSYVASASITAQKPTGRMPGRA